MINRLRVLKPPPKLGTLSRQAIPWKNAPTPEPQLIPQALPDLSLRRILVPFGFAETSALLLRRLIPLAKRTGAVLHLLHVVEPILPEGGRRRGSEDTLADAAQTVLTLWRESIIRGLVPAFSTVRIGCRSEEIAARAESIRADLVVMTANGTLSPSGSFCPSTAAQVINHAPCPTLTIPETTVRASGPDYDAYPPSSWKTLLMPIDFSSCARHALSYVAALSAENRAKLLLLNIMLEGSRAPASSGEDDYRRRLERQGERRLKEWVKRQMVLPLEFESVIWAGIPSLYAVPLEAKLSKVDLVVMPVRKGREAKLRTRSVRDHILRTALCPILSIGENFGRHCYPRPEHYA